MKLISSIGALTNILDMSASCEVGLWYLCPNTGVFKYDDMGVTRLRNSVTASRGLPVSVSSVGDDGCSVAVSVTDIRPCTKVVPVVLRGTMFRHMFKSMDRCPRKIYGDEDAADVLTSTAMARLVSGSPVSYFDSHTCIGLSNGNALVRCVRGETSTYYNIQCGDVVVTINDPSKEVFPLLDYYKNARLLYIGSDELSGGSLSTADTLERMGVSRGDSSSLDLLEYVNFVQVGEKNTILCIDHGGGGGTVNTTNAIIELLSDCGLGRLCRPVVIKGDINFDVRTVLSSITVKDVGYGTYSVTKAGDYGYVFIKRNSTGCESIVFIQLR